MGCHSPSSGVPVYAVKVRVSPVAFQCRAVSTKFFQWCSSVHWVNQWHSSGIAVYTGPASVHWLRVRVYVNVLCNIHRLLTMQNGRIVKSVFNSLHGLNNRGFPSWVSKSYDLAESYQIDMESYIELSPYPFKELCHERLKNSFILSWMTDLRNGCESSSISKT